MNENCLPFLYNFSIMSSFSSLNLSKTMLESLKKQKYLEPSAVQLRIIPKALQGKSLLCQAVTGSGKTHSYLIPIIDRIDTSLPRLQAIIITPSRELSRQVYEFAKPFQNYFQKLKIKLISSEEDRTSSSQGLSVPPHIVIGTPGRLKDILTDSYKLDLHGVKTLVLDEADMLMELGYFDSIDSLYSLLPEKVQTMVFSATLEENLKHKLEKYMGVNFSFDNEDNKSSANVSHHLVNIKHVGKIEALKRFLNIKNPYLAIIFASKKEDVKKVYEDLKENGYSVTMFSGDLDARKRKSTIKLIKDNKFQLIVASDLLSRGIDIEDVSEVISLDLPSDLEYYYHRAGRSGRFGKKGDSYVFYNSDSTKLPLELIAKGVKFDFLILKEDSLVPDPVGLLPKKKFSKKKPFSDEEAKEIKIAKAKTRTNKVKPAYKKKQKWAVERVKNKYKRKAIGKAIRKNTYGKED